MIRLRGTSLEKLDLLMRLQWMPSAELRAIHFQRLGQILQHAASNVPYYSETLRHVGLVNRSGQIEIDRFDEVPLLDKATLHERFPELKSTGLDQRRWFLNSSGGSTGETAQFIQDQEFAEWGRAVRMLSDRWVGYEAGDPKAVVWPRHPELMSRVELLRSKLGTLVRNEFWLDARRISSEQMRAFLGRIRSRQPSQVVGFPENLFDLAQQALAESEPLPPPAAVMSGGTTLFDWMRATIESGFGAPLFERYGTREFSDIAFECPSRAGLHVSLPTQHVEILRSDGSAAQPGDRGEVVVTSLVNYAMPLIRYRVGDISGWATNNCECGRSWPLLDRIEGRANDLFVKRDGTRVRIVEGVFHRHRWIRRFQVVQEDFDHVVAKVVPHSTANMLNQPNEDGPDQIRQDIQDLMGPTCKVEVVLTDHIDPAPSGKFQFRISKVWKPTATR